MRRCLCFADNYEVLHGVAQVTGLVHVAAWAHRPKLVGPSLRMDDG